MYTAHVFSVVGLPRKGLVANRALYVLRVVEVDVAYVPPRVVRHSAGVRAQAAPEPNFIQDKH